MPGTPKPIVDPRFGAFQTTMIQAAQRQQGQAAALAAGATQGNLVDQYGNTTQVSGTNLNQTVTIGASSGQPGVLVGTGVPNGTTGTATQGALATGTITVTQGSTSATLASTISGLFAAAQVIGADTIPDPTTSVLTSAIVPGTTFTISGTSITLSQAAAESGTVFCAACTFTVIGSTSAWIAPTLLNSWANTPGLVPAGFMKDSLGFVHLRGRLGGGTSGTMAFVLPAGYRPGPAGSAGTYPAGGFDSTTPVAAGVAIDDTGDVDIFYASGATDVGIGSISFFAEF